MYLKKKSFGITKDYGLVYGSASGQVILSFLQRLLVRRLARAAGYLSTLTRSECELASYNTS